MATLSHLQTNVHPTRIAFPDATLWDYDSFTSFSISDSDYEYCVGRVELLKEKVGNILVGLAGEDAIKKIEFINLLCRLGVSYHFEKEIEEHLNSIFDDLPKILDNKNYHLYTVSLLFQILRQYDYEISCDVFNKFKDDDKKFKTDISNDVRGVLGLYEASFYSVHGEDILDEALAFTRPHLEELLATQSSISPHLAQHIRNSLILPFHKGLRRLEAREYIDFYEKEESPNQILLGFAKLDFNTLQLLYKQELCELVRWWKNSNFAQKFPHARDRIVECYFWACGIQFKPQYTFGRIWAAKCIKVISIVDDTYDRCATADETKAFTDTFERFGSGAIDHLPDYMKHLYEAFGILFAETERMAKEGRSYCAHYTKELFKELLRSYGLEAQWSNDGYVPTFREYLENGCVTSSYSVIASACFTGMEEFAGIKEFEWLQTNPKILKSAQLIGRLLNDIAGHEEEQTRGDCASSIECYMKEHNVSKEKASTELLKMCSNAWKDINEECMRPISVSRPIREVLVNTTRATEVVYHHDDAYTFPASLKAKVTTLFIDPISM